MKRLSTWLMLSLAATLLVAGCGSSASSSSKSTAASQSTSTPAATAPGAATGSTASTTKSSPAITKSAIRKFAERSCRTQIQASLALTSTEKSKVEKLCEKAGTGVEASRAIARQVCAEIVKRAAVPGSPDTPARKEALEGCKSAK
ncbi:MAG: hypothetical protein QOE67_188 [Solirubrobacteraceae bacterium]|nr:hypothetical protein [Solirubrobacteraceae bacterium]MEA2335323.1 hypothetical protein [Solirubrobacteraceae bacterium]